eukprot:NODE_3750_length_747_cov_12.368497.p2 GENE.NODE_3750_length_747_cov_12.368497~~NODE_3750_length_747_cov_12.368497.p2  ORF type:complete len:196 (-),score=51.94 NODE_3750_length_747_cov_12.368497:145-732(-)
MGNIAKHDADPRLQAEAAAAGRAGAAAESQLAEEALLQPLLDMARRGVDPRLQAEAAAGLADAATEPLLAKGLCTPEAFGAFLPVLHCGGNAARSAMARVLSVLAAEPRAGVCFADEGFWQALLDVTVVQGVCEKLQRRFAEVAACAVALCAVTVPHEAAERQLQMLRATMKLHAIRPLVRDALSQVAALLPARP